LDNSTGGQTAEGVLAGKEVSLLIKTRGLKPFIKNNFQVTTSILIFLDLPLILC